MRSISASRRQLAWSGTDSRVGQGKGEQPNARTARAFLPRLTADSQRRERPREAPCRQLARWGSMAGIRAGGAAAAHAFDETRFRASADHSVRHLGTPCPGHGVAPISRREVPPASRRPRHCSQSLERLLDLVVVRGHRHVTSSALEGGRLTVSISLSMPDVRWRPLGMH